MPCRNCKDTPAAVIGGAGGAGGAGGDISGMQGDGFLEGFCFRCSVFWIIIVVLLFLMLAKSGKE